MTRRFWISAALSLPLFIVAMSDMLPGQPLQHLVSPRLLTWIQFVLATPVVLWGGWPFIERGWQSIVNRSLNMFTLDRHRRGRSVSVQRRGNSVSWYFSAIVLWP